jgi:arginase family enzyme
VISADGGQLGIIPTEEALGLARDAGLDLVEVAPHYEGPAQITALAGATIAHDELHLLAGAPRRTPRT